ncbi:hypothetical protein BDN70DRAFT_939984 [Pholiota conissans]|uniref:Uncharacterized protein n=1 Tax=Pholiota conissans TaxID=109636 RepID=A0A9P5YKA5_9AGAR|nr:hypothetical protein BDN70DRAFT_939984 [Pholiota conissans]
MAHIVWRIEESKLGFTSQNLRLECPILANVVDNDDETSFKLRLKARSTIDWLMSSFVCPPAPTVPLRLFPIPSPKYLLHALPIPPPVASTGPPLQ